jgi:hypothetical protein
LIWLSVALGAADGRSPAWLSFLLLSLLQAAVPRMRPTDSTTAVAIVTV